MNNIAKTIWILSIETPPNLHYDEKLVLIYPFYVGNIVSLEKRIQDKDDFNGYCTHTFRNWRLEESSHLQNNGTSNDCKCSIIGVTVDLMINFQ